MAPPRSLEEGTTRTPARRQATNQFAEMKPATPLRRASSAGPPSSRPSNRRTPGDQARTPGGQRLGSARRPIVVTPHGRAAQRELNLRRGLTPGRDRRRSGRQQRESPRDILRQLSRKLAPVSQPVVPTPEGANVPGHKRRARDDDLDDGPEIQRPRFSLPLGDEDDEDDSLLEPPKSAGLEDEDYTGLSIELPRRAISELPPGRLSRGSFGSVQMSDALADLNEIGGNDYNSSYQIYGDNDVEIEDNIELRGENTATLRGFDLQMGRISPSRESDIRPAGFPADDTTTEFVFTVPQRDPSEEAEAEPAVEPPSELNFPSFQDIESAQDETGDIQDAEDASPEELLDSILEDMEPDEVEILNSLDEGLQADISMQDTTMNDTTILEAVASKKSNLNRKKVKVSKHGIQYPSLPAGVVKKLATTFARTAGNSKAKVNKETLDAIMQATDWFFEQVSDDLGAYANHAGRKTIDESDIVALMARQRQTNATTTPFSLAQRYLPRELLQELRMVPPSKLKKGRHLESVAEDDDEG